MIGMNELDQKLHAAIHQGMMKVRPDQIFSPRVGLFDYLEKKAGFIINGRVLDIGCGSGYASIWLAKHKGITKAYALEASEAAVNELIPRNVKYHGVGSIVEPVLGSFDAIPFKNHMDFVVSFGSLHHSSCLFTTMRSVSDALKDGGYLIAQEPTMPNMTTNQEYINKYNIVEERFGLKIRNGDRNDNFFREAEYVVAAAFSGLDLVFYEDYIATPLGMKSRVKAKLKKLVKQVLRSGNRSGNGGLPLVESRKTRPKIMIFRKTKTDYIPHLWTPLKEIGDIS